MAVPVIGLGAGGHAKVVIEILRLNKQYELVGLLDSKPELKGSSVLSVPVLGDDQYLPELVSREIKHFFVGVGSIGDTSLRCKLYNLALAYGMLPVSAIHPQAIISPSAKIDSGVTVMAAAVINAGVILGANVVINTGVIVEHDCVVGDHVHIATGARLTSTIQVGAQVHIGAGATIKQCLTIGEKAIVGAGAVVVTDVPPGAVVVGVPARILKMRETYG